MKAQLQVNVSRQADKFNHKSFKLYNNQLPEGVMANQQQSEVIAKLL